MSEQNSTAEMVIDDVSKSYGFGPRQRFIIKDCSFNLEQGKITVLIGPSGCGKSTLVNLLAGYEPPDSGTISMGDQPIKGPGGDRLVVFQETALFPWMTIYSNVAFGPRAKNIASKADIRSMVGAMLEKVGLQDFWHKYPSHLSGGMQRRGELARMLVNNPKVMILDEPFRGLDAMTRELMQEYFCSLLEERHGTVLFITSEIEEAIFMADRILIMSNQPGHIVRSMDILLPRPRKKEMLLSEECQKYKSDALETLYDEALKAFSSGSRTMQDFLEAYQRQQEGESKAQESSEQSASDAKADSEKVDS